MADGAGDRGVAVGNGLCAVPSLHLPLDLRNATEGDPYSVKTAPARGGS